MKAVRGACNDDKPIYLFLDNARFHHNKEFVKPVWEELNIEPIWNVAYSPEYNAAVERYWGQLKAYFRPLLLQKMVKGVRARQTPLKDAVFETLTNVPRTSIPAYIDNGLSVLKADADKIRIERQLPLEHQ